MKLTRAEIGAVYEFMHKFRQNPDNPGLQLKQLKGDSRLWSARVNDDYRALLLHIDGHRLPRSSRSSTARTSTTTWTATRTGSTGSPAASRSSTSTRSATASSGGCPSRRGLQPAPRCFAALHRTQQLLDLGVAEPLLPSIAS